MTLGQLAKKYGPKFLLSTDDLDQFVKDRNLIVHDYWRLTKSGIRYAHKLESPTAFLDQFLRDCHHWEGILRELLTHIRYTSGGAIGGEQTIGFTNEDLVYMDNYHQHVFSHLDSHPE